MRTRNATAGNRSSEAAPERSRRVPKRPAETPAEPSDTTEQPAAAQSGAEQTSDAQALTGTVANSSPPVAPPAGTADGSTASPAGSGSPAEPPKQKKARGRPRKGKQEAPGAAVAAPPQSDQATQAAIIPPLQGNLSDAENAALQQQDAAQMEAARAAGKLMGIHVHLYDPGELHGPLTLHVPSTATVSFLKREIERLSGVMPRYQQVDIREPDRSGHWMLPEVDGRGQPSRLSQYFSSTAQQHNVYCSFLPHTPDPPHHDSNAAATLLAIQGVPEEGAAGQIQDPSAAALQQGGLQLALPQNPGAALPIAQPKRKPKSPSHQRPNNAKAGPWTGQEIEQLIVAMEKVPYGKWARVQTEFHFGHRSQVDLKDKWRNLAHAVVYKKQTRRVWLSDDQKERIIKCLPQYNPEQVPADQRATVPTPEQPADGVQPAAAVQAAAPADQHQANVNAQPAPTALPPDPQQQQAQPQQQHVPQESFVSQLQAPEQQSPAAAIALQQIL